MKRIYAGIGTLALIGLAACGSAASPSSAAVPTVRVTQTVTPKAAPSVTKTAAPTPVVTKTVAPVPTKTVYVAPPAPAAAAPAGLTNCIGGAYSYDSVYAGQNTSCPFALNVAADYTGPGVQDVYSPVTGQTYQVVGAGTVIATGGNDAYVQF
jgi:hypothetical protein